MKSKEKKNEQLKTTAATRRNHIQPFRSSAKSLKQKQRVDATFPSANHGRVTPTINVSQATKLGSHDQRLTETINQRTRGPPADRVANKTCRQSISGEFRRIISSATVRYPYARYSSCEELRPATHQRKKEKKRKKMGRARFVGAQHEYP